METRRMELRAGRKSLTEVKIQIGIFHGDKSSPLLFVIAMMLLNPIHRKCSAGYELSKSQEKDQPLYIHGRHQTFCKNEKEMKTQYKLWEKYSQDIRMEFGIEKYNMLVIKNGKKWSLIIWTNSRPGEWNILILLAFWVTNGWPNLGQTTRPNYNQEKRETLQDCGFCCPGRAQNWVEKMRKER